MLPAGLLLTLTLAIGFLAQSCDVGGLSIDDVRDTVTVTNSSPNEDALINLSTRIANVDSRVAAGASASFGVLATKTYTLEVWAPDDTAAATYRQSLVDLRAELLDLAINPGDSGATPEAAFAQILAVQTALEQLHGSKGFQTCTGSITTGLESQATISWSQPTGGAGFWVLSCG